MIHTLNLNPMTPVPAMLRCLATAAPLPVEQWDRKTASCQAFLAPTTMRPSLDSQVAVNLWEDGKVMEYPERRPLGSHLRDKPRSGSKPRPARRRIGGRYSFRLETSPRLLEESTGFRVHSDSFSQTNCGRVDWDCSGCACVRSLLARFLSFGLVSRQCGIQR